MDMNMGYEISHIPKFKHVHVFLLVDFDEALRILS